MEEAGLDIRNSDVEELDVVLRGESEKTLRDTGELVIVKMNFHDFQINLNRPASKVKVVTDDDWGEARWFDIDKLHTLHLTPPTRQRLQILGWLNSKNK